MYDDLIWFDFDSILRYTQQQLFRGGGNLLTVKIREGPFTDIPQINGQTSSHTKKEDSFE